MKKFIAKTIIKGKECKRAIFANDREEARRKLFKMGLEMFSLEETPYKANASYNNTRSLFIKRGFIEAVIVIFIIFTLAVLFFNKENGGGSLTASGSIYLNAQVKLRDRNFYITNKNNFNWENVKFIVNAGSSHGNYEFDIKIIDSRKTYILKTTQFARKDEMHLNTSLVLAEDFTIMCDTPKGKGYWHGR